LVSLQVSLVTISPVASMVEQARYTEEYTDSQAEVQVCGQYMLKFVIPTRPLAAVRLMKSNKTIQVEVIG